MSSPPRDEIVAHLRPTVSRTVAEVGFDLEELDVQQSGRRRQLRVIIDADDGVGLDDIAKVSRALSQALEEYDHVLAGPYTLEVTSPGVDRPLTRSRHWHRARNRLARIRLTDGGELLGRVGPAEETGVWVLVDGRVRRLVYGDIERAVVEVEFQQPPAEELVKLDRAADVAAEGDGKDTEESR
ncbi:ribosome maturation factor RimP [Actinopolyspora mortivallis]|uniref:ribosome maturation factor RimP n=1 Tax=Actinopolyspora mortivallis TaxID=33906 RepID=UPI00047C0DE6|nr:ribosome maturation factor RimP [Actinopolyspora mortivallis]